MVARTCWDCGRDDTYLEPDAVADLRAELAAANSTIRALTDHHNQTDQTLIRERAELAAAKTERDDLRPQPCIDCHGTGKCACGDCKGDTCALCDGVGRSGLLDRGAVATEMQRLSSRLAAALARAEVAEGKVARVKQLAISKKGPFLDRSEPPENENYNYGRWDTARAILAALEVDHV